jgi:ABC-type multidrug transport system permease subunit
MNYISISFIFTLCLITIYLIYDKINKQEKYILFRNIGNSPITNFLKPLKTISTNYDDETGKFSNSRYVRNNRTRN